MSQNQVQPAKMAMQRMDVSLSNVDWTDTEKANKTAEAIVKQHTVVMQKLLTKKQYEKYLPQMVNTLQNIQKKYEVGKEA